MTFTNIMHDIEDIKSHMLPYCRKIERDEVDTREKEMKFVHCPTPKAHL